MLTGADIVVLLKLLLSHERDVSSVRLANDLGMSQAQAYRAIRRGEDSGIVSLGGAPRGRKSNEKKVNRQALFELLAFGVPYVFPARPGRLERGMPTAGSAPILAKRFARDAEPIVWPHPDGSVRGMALEPLHPSVPEAAAHDPKLYELLALVDAIRTGRARERELAREELRKRLL